MFCFQWSGIVVSPTDPERGLTVTVPAGLGFPPVFYQQGSAVGAELRAFLLAKGYTAGYHWDWDNSQPAGVLRNTGVSAGGSDSNSNQQQAYAYAVPLAVLLALVAGLVTLYYVRALHLPLQQQLKDEEGSRALRAAAAGMDASERLLPAGGSDDDL